MEHAKKFLVDVLNLLPNEVDCFIQAPSLEDETMLSLMQESNFDYFKLIKIDMNNKETLIRQLLSQDAIQYFHKIQ